MTVSLAARRRSDSSRPSDRESNPNRGDRLERAGAGAPAGGSASLIVDGGRGIETA
jgi:hypothetical protein